MLPNQAGREYERDGYVVARGLFSADEIDQLRGHYMTLRRHGAFAGDFAGVEATESDPLKRYPRMIHMHRWDEVSLRWLLDQRINAWLTALIGRDTSFTGRTVVWNAVQIAIDQKPMWGYGHGFWISASPALSEVMNYLRWASPEAHNT